MSNVRELLAADAAFRLQKTGAYTPPELQLMWALTGALPRGRWSALRCPSDPGDPGDPGATIAPDLHSLLESGEIDTNNDSDVRRLAFYAIRDWRAYPRVVRSGERDAREEWIICDRGGDDGRSLHHADGIVVGLEDGTVRFMTRSDLGIAEDHPIIVGPGSPHPELRKLVSTMRSLDGGASKGR